LPIFKKRGVLAVLFSIEAEVEDEDEVEVEIEVEAEVWEADCGAFLRVSGFSEGGLQVQQCHRLCGRTRTSGCHRGFP
jgi:hypothetical protein